MTTRVRRNEPPRPTAVRLTEDAVKHIREFATAEGMPDANLRVAV